MAAKKTRRAATKSNYPLFLHYLIILVIIIALSLVLSMLPQFTVQHAVVTDNSQQAQDFALTPPQPPSDILNEMLPQSDCAPPQPPF